MTAADRGVMLLCCNLGQESAHPLTMAQFRTLSVRAHENRERGDPLRELSRNDLLGLGYDAPTAERILRLLDREEQLDAYLRAMERRGYTAVTRISADFPPVISEKMGFSSPPVLFCLGDTSLFQRRCISVVGSRKLTQTGKDFAETAGRLIAEAGFVLSSGGAEGADRTAQEACLAEGGSVIVFTAGRLLDCTAHGRVLYVSEEGCELGFSTARAMSRNRLIHAIGEKVLVAQTGFEQGGTWHGTADNLRRELSPVFVHDDGSDGARGLTELGAVPVTELTDLSLLQSAQLAFSLRSDETE